VALVCGDIGGGLRGIMRERAMIVCDEGERWLVVEDGGVCVGQCGGLEGVWLRVECCCEEVCVVCV